MTEREALKLALQALETLMIERGSIYDKAITAIKEALAQPEQEPVAWLHTKIEGVAVPHRPADLDKHPDRWEALYKAPPPCPTCEALARTVMLDQTSHDTTPPQRKPLTDEEIWVLTSEYNDYDQHGEYFEAVFIGKPTSKQIQKHCHVTEQGAVHILNGGGRVKYEDQWYNLRKEKAAHGIKGEA